MLVITFILMGAFGYMYVLSNQRIYPEDGIWYCEELQIYLHFDREAISKAIIDGEEVDCAGCYMKDSISITIERLYDFTWENQIIFSGEYVSLKGSELVLRNRDTKVEYTFVKIEGDKGTVLLSPETTADFPVLTDDFQSN